MHPWGAIVMQDIRYQFFISSTFDDLREERQQVIQAVLELGHIPVGMEIFPSADEEPWNLIRRTISESDYYIVLSGGRYGSTFADGVSFTEREFDFATELHIPIIGFIRRSPFDLPEARREDDPCRRERLLQFHSKIRQRYVRTWETVDELGLQALKAINYSTRMQPRTGWIRADRARSAADLEKLEQLRNDIEELEAEIKELTDENDKLRGYLRRAVIPDEEIAPPLLAQGDDLLSVAVRYKDGEEQVLGRVDITWDECFAAVGPTLYQRIHWRGYSGKFEFETAFAALLKRKLQLEGQRVAGYDRSEIERILFQFKQLGYMRMAVGKQGESGWTLTSVGETYLTKLLTQKRKLAPDAVPEPIRDGSVEQQGDEA